MDGKDAVIFDLDGVVVDSMPFHVASWQRAFREIGVEVSELDIYLNESATGFDVVQRMIREGDGEASPENIDRLLAAQAAIYMDEYLPRVRPFDGMPELISSLKSAGIGLGLVTGSLFEVARECLPGEVFGAFDAVVTRESTKTGKPHPEPYLIALKMLEKSPARCSAVENSPAGVLSAVRAGLRCLALTTTLAPEHLGEAHRIFGSIEELSRHLLGR